LSNTNGLLAASSKTVLTALYNIIFIQVLHYHHNYYYWQIDNNLSITLHSTLVN